MYEKICSFENLLKAFHKARQGKHFHRPILKFCYSLEENLLALQNELLTQTYLPSPYRHFQVFDPKQRLTAAPAFRDRVVQHALYHTIEPIFERGFINDSYACRKNKGTHFGLKRIKKFLMAARCFYGKERPVYFLKLDMKKYFPSIDWDILLSLIKKRISCPKTNVLIGRIVTTHQVLKDGKQNENLEEILSIKKRRGVPIGNLTSQLFANVYLDQLDHFVKEKLRIRWYGRYMDDCLIIDADKARLKKWKKKIAFFLNNDLKLKPHPNKTFISNVCCGIDFLGYRIFYDHVLIRAKTLRRFQRRYKMKIKRYQKNLLEKEALKRGQTSFLGHLKHGNTYGLRKSLFSRLFVA